jgi:uracil-DNA glycosylase
VFTKLEAGWRRALAHEVDDENIARLDGFIAGELAAGREFYPSAANVLSAFALTPFEQVKVVILGQDPYHGPDQAQGLAFSVAEGVPVPRSLQNIYRELERDLEIPGPATGNLEVWARQGVLLLNTTLTVAPGRPGSHRGEGWEEFTDACIRALSGKRRGLVFLLWGNHARAKAALIDPQRHHVLEAGHPSPLSVKGFAGCRHFSKTNDLLRSEGLEPIDWQLD